MSSTDETRSTDKSSPPATSFEASPIITVDSSPCYSPPRSTLCQSCRSIDLESVFKLRPAVGNPRKIASLEHVYLDRQPPCRLCTFFKDCLAVEQGDSGLTHHILPAPRTGTATLYVCGTSHMFRMHKVPPQWRGEIVDTACLVFKFRSPRACVLPTCGLYGQSPTFLGRPLPQWNFDLDLVHQWLHDCNKMHGDHCANASAFRFDGIQVIDCETRRIIPLPRDPGGSYSEYVSLSYVWGKRSTQSSSVQGRLPRSLPRLLRETILVTKQVGFRYLWIDRYCIPQENSRERHHQLRNMGHIYHGSSLTIIAAGSQDSGCGLAGVGTKARKSQPTIRLGDEGDLVLASPYRCRDDILSSKWNSRGWTYQEALLSRRRLIFTDTQVYFQCHSMHQSESISLNPPASWPRQSFPREVDIGRVFATADECLTGQSLPTRIGEYLQRELTYDDDVLRAFQGLMTRIEDGDDPASHLLGVPLYLKKSRLRTGRPSELSTLLYGLGWNTAMPLVRRHGFPSWTWAGWKVDLQENEARLSRSTPMGLLPPTTPLFYAEDGPILADVTLRTTVLDSRTLPGAEVVLCDRHNTSENQRDDWEGFYSEWSQDARKNVRMLGGSAFNSGNPCRLNLVLSGWTFEGKVAKDQLGWEFSALSGWNHPTRPEAAHLRYSRMALGLDDAETHLVYTVKCLVLYLASSPVLWNGDKWERVTFLVLFQTSQSHRYKRVGCASLLFKGKWCQESSTRSNINRGNWSFRLDLQYETAIMVD